MNDLRFPILGTLVPQMVGRAAPMDRVWGALTKPSPSHLSVIGPRYSGKSVFLKALSNRAQAPGSPYASTILWDLHHQTPQSDKEFLADLSGRIRDQLQIADPKRFSTYTEYLESGDYADLKEVVEALENERTHILILLDGLDRPLAADTLSRNLWDQLRELASKRSLRFVTASRRRLSDLIRSAATASSDFWGIFDPNPVQIGVMDDIDLKEAISRCDFGEIRPGVEQEIFNWSGLFPPLMFGLLNVIEVESRGRIIHPDDVNRGAESALVALDDVLAQLWDECPEPAKDLYRDLVVSGARPLNGIGWDLRERLIACGFASRRGSNLHNGCRLLEKFIELRRVDQGSIARLFQSDEKYRSNIRSILELRLGHSLDLDRDLKRSLERSVWDIPESPSGALVNMRNIAEKIFASIWTAEFGEHKKIPSELFAYWDQATQGRVQAFLSLQIPGELRPQCRLLQLLVGAEQNVSRRAKYFSRQTYHLINATVGYGHFGQHTEGENVGIGIAVCAILTALELANRVAEESPKVTH
jgi:hypothetical protein